MAKRRYNAKRIAQTPSLKRKLAELLADHHPEREKVSLSQMLAYGHRGYISYSEDDLCKLFDKLYSQQLEHVAERRKELEQELKHKSSHYTMQRIENDLKSLERHIAKFEEVAGLIFEEKVLL